MLYNGKVKPYKGSTCGARESQQMVGRQTGARLSNFFKEGN